MQRSMMNQISTFSIKTWSRLLICPFVPVWLSSMLTGRQAPEIQVFCESHAARYSHPTLGMTVLWPIKPSSWRPLPTASHFRTFPLIVPFTKQVSALPQGKILPPLWKATSLHLWGTLIQERLGTVTMGLPFFLRITELGLFPLLLSDTHPDSNAIGNGACLFWYLEKMQKSHPVLSFFPYD